MGTTQSIKDKKELKNFIDYYQNVNPNPRNYALIIMGLHTALRISDILNLKWKDVYNFKKHCYFSHLFIHEQKTGKTSLIAVNIHIKDALKAYYSQTFLP